MALRGIKCHEHLPAWCLLTAKVCVPLLLSAYQPHHLEDWHTSTSPAGITDRVLLRHAAAVQGHHLMTLDVRPEHLMTQDVWCTHTHTP